MVAGQVGEAMTVAVVPVVLARNIEADLVLILDREMADVIALDLLLKEQNAIYRHVRVLRFNFLNNIHTYI